jgi:fructose-1-phosphate kinase PfkB-like protein
MLACLPGCPDIAKMNRDEFGWTFNCEVDTLSGLIETARQVYTSYGLKALVVTCGADGMIACTPQGYFHALPPSQTVVNAAGAGDAASAALAWRLSIGDGWSDALRWTAAVSAASVLSEGTSDLRMEDVSRIFEQVKIKSI